VLIGLGLLGLARLRSPREEPQPQTLESSQTVTAQRSERRTFTTFLGLTLLNPATVAYFAALVVGLPSLAGVPERIVFVAAVFIASLSWQSLLAYVGALLGRSAGQRLRVPTIVVGNLVIIVLGLLIGAEAMRPV
jgi:arginine exporter protein ArgO